MANNLDPKNNGYELFEFTHIYEDGSEGHGVIAHINGINVAATLGRIDRISLISLREQLENIMDQNGYKIKQSSFIKPTEPKVPSVRKKKST